MNCDSKIKMEIVVRCNELLIDAVLKCFQISSINNSIVGSSLQLVYFYDGTGIRKPLQVDFVANDRFPLVRECGVSYGER